MIMGSDSEKQLNSLSFIKFTVSPPPLSLSLFLSLQLSNYLPLSSQSKMEKGTMDCLNFITITGEGGGIEIVEIIEWGKLCLYGNWFTSIANGKMKEKLNHLKLNDRYCLWHVREILCKNVDGHNDRNNSKSPSPHSKKVLCCMAHFMIRFIPKFKW